MVDCFKSRILPHLLMFDSCKAVLACYRCSEARLSKFLAIINLEILDSCHTSPSSIHCTDSSFRRKTIAHHGPPPLHLPPPPPHNPPPNPHNPHSNRQSHQQSPPLQHHPLPPLNLQPSHPRLPQRATRPQSALPRPRQPARSEGRVSARGRGEAEKAEFGGAQSRETEVE